jgi:DNA-binding MarR family transcriptional regulator
MTELVLPLEQAGAIVRRPDPAHGRILRIEFTSTGERLLARAIEIAGKVEEELLAGLTERDRNHLGRSFRKLMANAETFDSDRRRRSRKGRGSNATKKSGPMRGRAR